MPLGLRLVQSQKPYLSEITTLTYNASGCGNGGFEDRNFKKEVSNLINGMESKNHHNHQIYIYHKISDCSFLSAFCQRSSQQPGQICISLFLVLKIKMNFCKPKHIIIQNLLCDVSLIRKVLHRQIIRRIHYRHKIVALSS